MFKHKRTFTEFEESLERLNLQQENENNINKNIEEEEVHGCITKKKQVIAGEAIKTFCRMRPSEKSIFSLADGDERTLLVNSENMNLKKFEGYSNFTFSRVFDGSSSQEDVFNNTCLSLIEEMLFRKKSGLIFTYGMTNAGKTYTVIGDNENPGILPRSLSQLYSLVKENGFNFNITSNFIEIYNEEVFDLLASDPKNPKFKKKVQVKERDKRFVIQDITYIPILTNDDFKQCLSRGLNKKVHSSTNMNHNSSRSHTIFKIIIQSDELDEDLTLSIVDLAGSERANRTDAQGKELQEACKINQSLSILGKCLEALKHNSNHLNKRIVPFRESKLTMLFQEYFMGNHNIIMITNINPRVEDFEETMRALIYSCTAKEIKPIKPKIVNVVKKKQKYQQKIVKDVEGENIENNVLGNEAEVQINTTNLNNRLDNVQLTSILEQLTYLKNEIDQIKEKNSEVTVINPNAIDPKINNDLIEKSINCITSLSNTGRISGFNLIFLNSTFKEVNVQGIDPNRDDSSCPLKIEFIEERSENVQKKKEKFTKNENFEEKQEKQKRLPLIDISDEDLMDPSFSLKKLDEKKIETIQKIKQLKKNNRKKKENIEKKISKKKFKGKKKA